MVWEKRGTQIKNAGRKVNLNSSYLRVVEMPTDLYFFFHFYYRCLYFSVAPKVSPTYR